MAPQIQVIYERDSCVFAPGEVVSGKVAISSDDAIKCRAVEVRFRGKSHNRWYDHARKACYCKEEYYAENTVSVWPESGRSRSGESLPAGLNEFPFTFKLPDNAPCTFEGKVGWVRYTIFVKIDVHNGRDVKSKCMFTVLPKADLNDDKTAQEPAVVTEEKKMGYIGGEPLSVRGTTDKGGYVPGEPILVKLNFTNKSKEEITKIAVALQQKSSFYGKGAGKLTYVDKSTAAEIKESTSLGKETEWSGKIIVPSLPPSDLPGCTIIDLQYYLKIEVVSKRNIKIKIPFRIGTMPLRTAGQHEDNSPPPTYVASVFGSVDPKEEDDEDMDQNSEFAPLYAYYNWERPYADLSQQMHQVSIENK